MNNKSSLQANSIKKQLVEQEKKLQEITVSKQQIQKQLEEYNADEETIRLVISALKSSLEDNFGEKYNPEMFLNNDKPILSKDYTLQILQSSENALQTKDIVALYEKENIKTYNRNIDDHLRELLKEGLIYQTNPENQRGRLFKATE